jgi:hypothetical protein
MEVIMKTTLKKNKKQSAESSKIDDTEDEIFGLALASFFDKVMVDHNGKRINKEKIIVEIKRIQNNGFRIDLLPT